MQITEYQLRSTESETLRNLHHKLSKWFWSISSLTCTGLKLFCIVDSISVRWLLEVGLLNQRIKMLLETKEKLHYSQVLKGIHTFSFSIWFHVLHLLYLSFVWTVSWCGVWEIHFHLFGYSVVPRSLHTSYTKVMLWVFVVDVATANVFSFYIYT